MHRSKDAIEKCRGIYYEKYYDRNTQYIVDRYPWRNTSRCQHMSNLHDMSRYGDNEQYERGIPAEYLQQTSKLLWQQQDGRRILRSVQNHIHLPRAEDNLLNFPDFLVFHWRVCYKLVSQIRIRTILIDFLKGHS